MGKMGKFTASDLKKLQKQLNKIHPGNVDAFVEGCAKELAARLLAKVIKRTPVGDYSGAPYTCASGEHHKGHKVKGKVGGTLRRGWTSQQSGSGSEGLKTNGAKGYVDSLKINHYGGFFVIEIVNPVEYASYVEFGHRTADHKVWVQGHFMLTISEQEIQAIAPKVLEAKIKKYLAGCMK